MKRTFKLEVPQCTCGGRREAIALIPPEKITAKILAHLRLPIMAERFLPIPAPPWGDVPSAGSGQTLAWPVVEDEVDRPLFGDDAA